MTKLWSTRILTNNGYFSKKLEVSISRRISNPNTILFTNGHLSLEYILEALNKKGEVITTPFTFISTTQSIVRTGNVPVFCDIKDDFTIDESIIEKLINKNTIAVLAVHVYGNVCAVDKLNQIGKKYGLFIIYDAAHSFNVSYKGKDISQYGDFVMYSFQATKVFHTIEGGALSTNNRLFPVELFERKKNFGQFTSESVSDIGGNAKIDEIRSIIGLLNLKKFPIEVKKRSKIYERYKFHLGNIKGITLNSIQKDVITNYSYFPVVFNNYKLDRDQVCDLLKKYGVFSRKYFFPLTSEAKAFQGLFPIQKTPKALEYSNKVLTLPLYGELYLRDVDRICKIILRGY